MRKIKHLVAALAILTASGAHAQEQVFQLDPAKSEVDFTLGDVLHTVHGKFQLSSGVLRFDSTTGEAGGELVVNAQTGDSGNNTRDKKMKHEILETDKFPTIVFVPQKVIGMVTPNGGSQVQMLGTMTLHGQPHPMTLVIPVQVSGTSATALVHFEVPFVAWGLKDPSTLFLRVNKTVDIDVHAVGTLATQVATARSSH